MKVVRSKASSVRAVLSSHVVVIVVSSKYARAWYTGVLLLKLRSSVTACCVVMWSVVFVFVFGLLLCYVCVVVVCDCRWLAWFGVVWVVPFLVLLLTLSF